MVPENEINEFLCAFFATMDGQPTNLRIDGCKVYGRVEYQYEPRWDDDPDEGWDDFMWDLNTQQFPQEKVKVLCGYLAENELVDIDMITISEDELVKRVVDRFAWSSEDATAVVDELMDVYIRMVDDGELSDAFYLHF